MAMDGLHPLVGTFLMLLFLVLPCLFVLLAGAQAAARSSMVNLVLHDNADAADAENFLTMKRTKESSVLGDLGMKSQKRMKESSVLGDPGMKSQKVRVAVEGWNFCNRVGEEDSPPQSPSPRWADCADLDCNLLSKDSEGLKLCNSVNRVSEADNQLKTGDPFPTGVFENSHNADVYVVEKEKYLASLCKEEEEDDDISHRKQQPWHFWMIMLKNGNFDTKSSLCKSYTSKPLKKSFLLPQMVVSKKKQESNFLCFGPGCMNQPLVYHNWSTTTLGNNNNGVVVTSSSAQASLAGSFYGTYDVEESSSSSVMTSHAATAATTSTADVSSSYFSVAWEKNLTSGSWIFTHHLSVSRKYPWLMLYLRADATSGESGGYPWETRGMMKQVPVSPNFKVTLTLNVIQGGGPASQFYLIDIGGCWKNNGKPCDGDLDTDVTRYVEMIINPKTSAWCSPWSLNNCPPYHIDTKGTKIHRTDKKRFPYSAYHLYCSPPNAAHAVAPLDVCDPYSNPQPQELVQLLPHPEWAVHGYPSKKGEGWVGDPRTWVLDVGALSNRLYFYQDPGTEPATRAWPSIDVGTEVYESALPYTAEWTVSDFDVLVSSPDHEKPQLFNSL
ncbi:hypothetical protein BDL97_09G008900 [Sphagnum fallax]|nr:hypothetical protein BDL97_09G008900 [Sphagnum fallax]